MLLNDRFFNKEIVKFMFDVKVRTNYNKLRYGILKEYIKKDYTKEIEGYLRELKIIIDNYMNFYNKKFNKTAYYRNLEEAEKRNISFKEKYRLEKESVKEFQQNKSFPVNSYPMSFNNFVKELIKDVRDEIEKLKEQDKEIFKIK